MAVASFKALGTEIFVDIKATGSEAVLRQLEAEAERIEHKFSRFLPHTELTQFNQRLNQWHEIDAEWHFLLTQYLGLSQPMAQHLSLATTELLEHWGYDADYNLKQSAPKIDAKTFQLDLKSAAFNSNQALDFGCFGKGYFLDRCREILEKSQIDDYLVNAGGDMIFSGAARTFYLEDPRVNGRCIGACELSNGFLCASSASRRQWGNFHHLINANTQKPANEMLAVFVQSNETGLITDALSTAFFVMGFETAQTNYASIKNAYPSVETLFISARGEIWRSANFVADLYTT